MFPGVRPTPAPQIGLLKLAGPNRNFVQYLPFDLIREPLVKKFRKKLQENEARRLLNVNMAAVEKRMKEYKAAEKEMPIRIKKVTEIMKEQAEKYHLTLGQTTQLDDKLSIGDDPALKPLKEAYLGGNFSDLFFSSTGAADRYVPKTLNQIFPDSDKKPFIYWVTEDQEAKVLDSYQSIREEVVKQWKLQKARKLARKKAEEVVKAIEKASDDAGRAELLRAQESALRKEKILKEDQGLIPLFKVAPLVSEPAMTPGSRSTTRPYRITDASFSYPKSEEWAKKLLSMGAGGATVQLLDNQPESIVYVAARTSAPEASIRSFMDSCQSKDGIWLRWNRRFAKDLYNRKVEELKKKTKFEDLRSKEAKERTKDKKDTQVPAEED
jgi:hypothetical protein